MPDIPDRDYFLKIKSICEQFLNHQGIEPLDADNSILNIEEVCQKYWNVEKV